ncbi:MAG: hypothetical protein PHQ75_07835 [Thermoguttaceae bacterium]|nr:hypothetical protein [Thermoguttaceae bacterium]
MQSAHCNNRLYTQTGPILWGIVLGIVLLGLFQCVCPNDNNLASRRLAAMNRCVSSPLSHHDSSSFRDEQHTEQSHSFDCQDGIQYDYGFCPDDHGMATGFLRTFRTAPSSPLKQVKREGSRCLGGLPGAEQMVHVYRSDADRALLIPPLCKPLYLMLQFFRN